MGHGADMRDRWSFSLQMTGRALISLKVIDANAMSASFDPRLPDPRGALACLARS